MSATPMTRTQYWNLATNTLRGGTTGHGESVTDMESGLLPLARATESSLHSWGVADGLTVTAIANSDGLTIAPGTGLDVLGRLIALAPAGVAVVDPTVAPGQMVNVPTVPVADTGVVLATDALTAGVLLLTVEFREVQDQGQLANAPVLLHAPWLRLQALADVPDDGRQLVLARVTLSAGGLVTGLDATGRRPAGLPVGRLELRRPIASAGPPLAVSHVAGAALAVGGDGSVALTGITGGPDVPLLGVDAALTTLALLPNGGSVSVGFPGTPRGTVHAEGSEVHSGGQAGGFSFADRGAGSFVDAPDQGQRWVWYADAGQARLWSGTDRLTVDAVDQQVSLQPGGGRVTVGFAGPPQRTLQVEGSGVHSGGGGGGYSFADRGVGSFVESPSQGERWVWYASGGVGRLWSGKDLLTVTPTADGGTEWGHADGPAMLSLWGSRILDVGNGILAIRSGGGVVAFDGDDSVGIGTTSPTGRLGVEAPGIAIWADNTQDGFFASAVFARGMTGVIAEGRNTGAWAAGGTTGLLASGPTAGQFFGDVSITGTLSKGGGGFRIDHPLDAANRYLSHSFVESPEMLNIYRGTVTTDDEGDATVELPAYVEALNADFSYHLTVVGDVGTAGVTRPLQDNRFGLRTDRPATQVCWLLLGVRQDAWAQAHRIQVEEDKPDDGRDRYLHPELFGPGARRAYAHPEYERLLERPEASA